MLVVDCIQKIEHLKTSLHKSATFHTIEQIKFIKKFNSLPLKQQKVIQHEDVKIKHKYNALNFLENKP